MLRDHSQALVAALIFGPAVLAADNTPVAIDLVDASSSTLLIGVGVGGITFSDTNKIEFKLTHCDTEGGTYVDVTADDVVINNDAAATIGDGGIVRSLVAAHAAASVTKIGYKGARRYLKLLADFSGTHGTGTIVIVTLLQSRLHRGGTI